MKSFSPCCLAALAWLALTGAAHAQGTAFTYQGRLTSGTTNLTGLYDFTFALFNASSAGAQAGATLNSPATPVTNGLFTATLDFGAQFPGAGRWLEITVRTNGGGAFTTLTPRQRVTATPYAITASNITGLVPAASLAGTYSSAVTLNNAGNSFTGNGVGLTSLNANNLASGTVPDARLASNIARTNQVWQTAGNLGTTPGTDFLGTRDNQALELKVNNSRALRLEPNLNGAPNVIGGSLQNLADAGVIGATVAGGGAVTSPFGPTTNRVRADFGSVGGGGGNEVGTNSAYATIGGGFANLIRSNSTMSTVGGGQRNLAEGFFSTVGGGNENRATNSSATVGGGQRNVARNSATVGGGEDNLAGSGAVVSGGIANHATGFRSVVGGGDDNRATATHAQVGGGWFNLSSGNAATVAGGEGNFSGGPHATVGGGFANYSTTNAATIGGGAQNSSTGNSSTVGGGLQNQSTNAYATIGGGAQNIGGSSHATIGGGASNVVFDTSEFATIGGGQRNIVSNSARFATIGGGQSNVVNSGAIGTVVAGGEYNRAGSDGVVIGGGRNNDVRPAAFGSTIAGGLNGLIEFNASAASIGGGFNNRIGSLAIGAVIGGGSFNQVTGPYGTIPGGAGNEAGTNAFAAGGGAKARHTGSFVWADARGGEFASTSTNQFLIRAGGGVGIGANVPAAALHILHPTNVPPPGLPAADNGLVLGVYRTDSYKWIQSYGGSLILNPIANFVGINKTNPASALDVNGVVTANAFNPSSDRNLKENFTPVSPREVLEKVSALAITRWNFKGDGATPHLGPMAQDFHAAFGLGTDERHIATVDADGVALAAIQGLNHKVESEKKKAEMERRQLRAENAELKARLEKLERLLIERDGGAR